MEENLKIAHANHLVEACYDLDINELRLIALGCTKYRFTDNSYDSVGDVVISLPEFIERFGLKKSKGIYSDLKKAVKGIMRKPIKIYDEKTKNIEEYAWVVKNSYSKDDSVGTYITLKFSPEISPYLFELKNRFTVINFEYAAKLNTPFSFRLYQWLYKAKDLEKHKKGQSVEMELSLDWIKKQACLNKNYDRWDNFKQYVIAPAVEKINAVTDISINWEPIKTGRSVTALRFNYILEKATQQKPVRPRLKKRPKVKAGSHEHGEWMRANYNLLSKYRTALKTYDKTLSLSLPDLRKMHDYALGIGYKDIADWIKKEIDERTPAPKSHQYTASEKAHMQEITKQESLIAEFEKQLAETQDQKIKQNLINVISFSKDTLKMFKESLGKLPVAK